MVRFCDHCGLPISGDGIRNELNGENHLYCCYGCRLIAEIQGKQDHPDPTILEDPNQQQFRYRLFLGTLLTGFVMVLSIAISSEYGIDSLRELHHRVSFPHYLLLFIATPVFILLGIPLLRTTTKDLFKGRLSLEVLFTLGTSSAVIISLISYLRGTGPIYLETATMLLALYSLGRYIDTRVKGETGRIVGHLLEVPVTRYQRISPDRADVFPDDMRFEDVIRIRAGEVFPVDGVIMEGQGFVDESSLTGEARPVMKTPGDEVSAGTGNLDGLFVIRTTSIGGDRRLARIEKMMREALEKSPRWINITDHILQGLIPAALVIAITTFVFWYSTVGYEKALFSALSVVLITCPCALGLAIPLVFMVATGDAARRGVLVRSGEVFFSIERIRTILFDKTGTLSEPRRQSVRVVVPELTTDLGVDGRIDGDTLLQYAASLERAAHHILAAPIIEEAHQRGLDNLPIVEAVVIPGAGITGTVKDGALNHKVCVGSAAVTRLFTIQNAHDLMEDAYQLEQEGNTVLYVAVDEEIVGLIVLGERVVIEARETVESLKEMGFEIMILTGDRSTAGDRMAQTLQIPTFCGLSPDEKIRWISLLRSERGNLAMVGDGLNDAAAIASADLGIALASGAGVTVQAADVILYNPDLRNIPWLFRLSRRTTRAIRQNLFWTFAYNTIGMGIAAAGLLHPLAAVTLMLLSSSAVTYNTLRLKRFT